MSDNQNNNNLFNKILVPVIVALLVGGTAPWWWTEIFAKADSEPAPATETSEPSPPETVSSNPVVLGDRLLGKWSSEGDVRATHILELEIETIRNNEISGVLTSRNIDSDGYSGIMSIIGELQNDAIEVEIVDGRGFEVGEAELSLDGDTLTWRLGRIQGIGKTTIPSLAYLWKYE